MKKTSLCLVFLATVFFSFGPAGQLQKPAIQIPVRVADGGQFVDSLSLQDFELYDEGRPQKIEAMCLIRKTDIGRKEGEAEFEPATSRHFYLLFQILSYDPRLAEAIDHLFQSVLNPEDTLTIMTLTGKYDLSKKAFETKPKEKLAQEMQGLIRKDTMIGASNYNSILKDLKRLVAGMVSGEGTVVEDTEVADATETSALEFTLPRYRESLERLEELRFVDEQSFVQFAQMLKAQKGQNYVFLFYEREFRPEINQAVLNRLMSMYQTNQNILDQLQELFMFYNRTPAFDGRKILGGFLDSSLLFNMIFIITQPEASPGVYMKEQSEDIFSAFSEISRATGGITDTSQNPGAAFKKTCEHLDSYYLLAYTPPNYVKDGSYRSISVYVRGKEYALSHPAGYFATR